MRNYIIRHFRYKTGLKLFTSQKALSPVFFFHLNFRIIRGVNPCRKEVRANGNKKKMVWVNVGTKLATAFSSSGNFLWHQRSVLSFPFVFFPFLLFPHPDVDAKLTSTSLRKMAHYFVNVVHWEKYQKSRKLFGDY